MSFAQRELEKYGWTKGSGLGKNQTGITEALKPKIKLNKGGIGHKFGEEHTDFWWEKSFNKVASGLKIDVSSNNVSVKSTENGTRSKNKSDLYMGFLKKGTNKDPEATEEIAEPEEPVMSSTVALTDEELFKACGGRTSHKGARHGLKLSGKLARIKQQEEALLAVTYRSNQLERKRSSDDHLKKKRRKVEDVQ